MATKSAVRSSVTHPHKVHVRGRKARVAGRVNKRAARRVAASSKPVAKAAVKTAAKSTAKPAGRGWAVQEKQYARIFGVSLPKGKVLLADGRTLDMSHTAQEGLGVLQFPPKVGRTNWIYVTHGLSQSASRVELMVHWKERDDKLPARILSEAARALRAGPRPLPDAFVLTPDETFNLRAPGVSHWIGCRIDAASLGLPELPGPQFVLLQAISDAEHQIALKVNAQLADGRHVLLEALRSSGIFPVCDFARACLTRRRDFHRIWETAFRVVRDRKSSNP